jgi:hypothetical protein
MHQNPVKRGLVLAPEDWKWSSYRTYTFNESGAVNMDWHFPPFTMHRRPISAICRLGKASHSSNPTMSGAPGTRQSAVQ